MKRATAISKIIRGKGVIYPIITPAVKCRRILRRINFHLQGGRMSCSECYND